LADQGDLSVKQQKEVLKITQTFLSDLLKQWDLFRKGKKVKAIIVK
jgi:3-methyladenine DNA glycosylase Tag